jgi:hypothetical protein
MLKARHVSSGLNFIRVGCPTSTIIHVPLSVAKLRKSARQDISKSTLSLHDIIDTSYKFPRTAREVSPEIAASINSLRFPKQEILKDCIPLSRHFTLSPIEPTKGEQIDLAVRRDLRNRRRRPVETEQRTNMESSEYSQLRKSMDEVWRLKGTPTLRLSNLKERAKIFPYSHPESGNFFKALKLGKIAELRKMISIKPSLINTVDFVGQTALHWAVKRDELQLVEFLASHGADLNAVDMTNRSPLFIALRLDRAAIVKHLLDCGADPYLRSMDEILSNPAAKNSASWVYFQDHLKRLERKSVFVKDKQALVGGSN